MGDGCTAHDDRWLPADASEGGAHSRTFVVTSGAQHEHVIDDGVYGAQTGMLVEGDAQAEAVNLAVDGSVNDYVVTGTGPSGLSLVNLEGCGCSLGGVGLSIAGGTVDVFNLLTLVDYKHAIAISKGSYQIEGGGIHQSFAAISGGSGVMAGVWFQQPGTQVSVSGASTTANLWGNTGQGGFAVAYSNGAPTLLAGNIPR